jgi:hypothetical protein
MNNKAKLFLKDKKNPFKEVIHVVGTIQKIMKKIKIMEFFLAFKRRKKIILVLTSNYNL